MIADITFVPLCLSTDEVSYGVSSRRKSISGAALPQLSPPRPSSPSPVWGRSASTGLSRGSLHFFGLSRGSLHFLAEPSGYSPSNQPNRSTNRVPGGAHRQFTALGIEPGVPPRIPTQTCEWSCARQCGQADSDTSFFFGEQHLRLLTIVSSCYVAQSNISFPPKFFCSDDRV